MRNLVSKKTKLKNKDIISSLPDRVLAPTHKTKEPLQQAVTPVKSSQKTPVVKAEIKKIPAPAAKKVAPKEAVPTPKPANQTVKKAKV